MRFGYLLFFFPLGCGLFAQTEQSVNLEKRFIEAKREALLGKTEEATKRFEELAEEAPQDDAIQFELARLYFAAGNNENAIKAMKVAYDLRPSDVYTGFLAELYQATGRYAAGADLYADRRKTNPADEEYYLEQAAFLVRGQQIKAAVGVYNDLEKRIGVNPEISRRKHALFLGQGDQKKAEQELLRLVEAFPTNLSYRHLLAGYYRSQGSTGKATRAYQEIIRLEPNDVKAQLALQEASPGKSSDDELMALLARADVDIDLKIGKLLPLVQRVASSQDAALAQRALVLATELRRVHPDEAKAAAIEADLLFQSGRLTEAANAYAATLTLDDTVFPVWEQLLATLYLNDQMKELRQRAEEALDIFPNRPSVYVHYALAEAFRADWDEALSLLQQAQLMVSADPAATAALMELEKSFTALREGYESGKDLDYQKLPGGSGGPIGRYLGLTLANTTAPASSPQNTNALLLELLGDRALDAGDKALAETLYRRAKAAGSKSASLSRKLSQVKS